MNTCQVLKDTATDKLEWQKDINFIERLKKIISKIKAVEIQNNDRY